MSDGIDKVCVALQAAGIDCVFGVPGTQNVTLFDAFRRHGLRTVLATHELAASFMANGHYRATGRPAALATIPGPGFTYALTGLAEARLDSVGLIYLVGTPATEPGRAFQLQAIDQTTIAGPLVKAMFSLSSEADVATVIAEACRVAVTGGPGPTMVQMDLDALSHSNGTTSRSALAPTTTDGATASTDSLAELFANAKRPVFYLGNGSVDSAPAFARLSTTLNIPILTTPSARGIVAEDDVWVMGFDSLRGHVDVANSFLDQSDLIVALGCKLGHNGSAGFELRLAQEKLVHVDADARVPGANYDTKLSIVSTIAAVLPALEKRTAVSSWKSDEVAPVRTALRAIDDPREPLIQTRSGAVQPSKFFRALRAEIPRDAIVVTDSGRHQILTRRHFHSFAPRGLVVPSDFQSMGFGLPAAVGAKIAAKNRPVVAIIGDGGFAMSGMEALTARREGLALPIIVFNDGQLSQIRTQQLGEFGHAHAVQVVNPNFEMLAQSFGIGYVRYEETTDGWLDRLLRAEGPTLVEVVLGDSLGARVAPIVAQAKGVARSVIRPGARDWLKAMLKRGSK